MDEAHVEHPVGLIENEVADRAQIERALAGKVEQPSGRGDEQIAAIAQGIDLRIDAHAAEDDAGADFQVPSILPGALRHLGGQLPRGGENERARGAGGRALRERLQNREDERGSLAGAGLRPGEHVTAGDYGGNRPHLDGSRRLVALLGDRARQLGREPEIRKRHVLGGPLCWLARGVSGRSARWHRQVRRGPGMAPRMMRRGLYRLSSRASSPENG
jgi:hypothetical protein